jgi:RHS repeat-associated protein
MPPGDGDGDGVPDEHDNCVCAVNPGQQDTDADGRGDACDECETRLVELPIYGLGRVGVARPDISLSDPPVTGPVYQRHLGEKYYELADHLGNVRMVITDRKLSVLSGGVPGQFHADVRAYTNLYPFGMPQPGRFWDSSLTYRFGYTGMESDAELKGGSHYTTLFRQYDPRLGRWWSTDPITHEWESPYAGMGNNPIALVDRLGLEGDEPTPLEPGRSGRSLPTGWIEVQRAPDGSRYVPTVNVVDKKPPYTEGQDITIGYWPLRTALYVHNGEPVTEDAYRSLVRELVAHYFDADFDPATLGFHEGAALHDDFFEIVAEEGRRRWGKDDFGPNGEENPFAIKGIEDNSLEVFGLISGGAALTRAAAGAVVRKGIASIAVRRSAGAAARHFAAPSTRLVPGGGLAAHEAAGGHLLARHVGQTEAQLFQRLAAEPQIATASSFFDRPTAESVISIMVQENEARIAEWLAGNGKQLILTRSYSIHVGINVARGASAATYASSARVILRRSTSMPLGYRIHTGFPEP